MGQRSGEIGRPARMDYQPRIAVEIESDGRSRQGERPEEIEARIAYTRAELSETLQELQERLNPAHVAEQVKSSVRAATIGRVEEMVHKAGHTAEEARLSMMDTIRQNPVPAAMVGIGLAWLMTNRSSRSDTQRYHYAYEYEGPEYGSYQSGSSGYGASQGRVRQMAGSVQERAGTMASSVQERAGTMVDNVQERASSMAGSVQEGASTMVDSVQQGVGNVAHQARHVVDEMTDDAQFLAQQIAGTVQEQASHVRQQVSELGTGMQHQARVAGDRMQGMLRENPMGVGVMALAAGMVVGMLLPETRLEHQVMGETRDHMMHQARQMASETMQKVQHVASEVASETMQQVQSAASDVADTATRAVGDVADTAKRTAREEGLTSA